VLFDDGLWQREDLFGQLVERAMPESESEPEPEPEPEPAAVPEPPANPAPVFQIQQNTQDIELRALVEEFPSEIFNTNYQLPTMQALAEYRSEVRSYIAHIRRLEAAHFTWHNTPARFVAQIDAMMRSYLSSREMRFARDPDATIQSQETYASAQAAIEMYKIERDRFHIDRVTLGPAQARYNQQVAMIRQRPQVPMDIHCQTVLETVSQWENVWGITAYKNNREETVQFRIGLCNIAMNDSASETAYNDPMEILLAPLYFTLQLNSRGNFLCSSMDGNARGLSRSEREGRPRYDFHPHQLSDTPCFGTFGQTFIDLANKGEVVALIGGLIAFYSQYNSQDSAGVYARMYHPRNLRQIENIEDYTHRLRDGLECHSTFSSIDPLKLNHAVTDYCAYHENERCNDAPEIAYDTLCHQCDSNPVGDNDSYTVDHYENRICDSCWEEYYCRDCERPNDNCRC